MTSAKEYLCRMYSAHLARQLREGGIDELPSGDRSMLTEFRGGWGGLPENFQYFSSL